MSQCLISNVFVDKKK
eukprot:UN14751